MGPAGFVAVIAGWVTTEVGRQPFTVYGLLSTADFGLAARGPGRRRVAAGLHRRLFRRVRRRHRLHPDAHEQAAASRRGRRRSRTASVRCAPPASRRHPPSIRPAPSAMRARRRNHDDGDRHFLDLPTLWAFIIAFAVFAYVVMDGFDLGIGILFPFFQPGRERDSAMNSVAPVWDGNETWLVLGGGGLMAAFPLALRDHPAGALRADHRHAAGAGLPRRRLRVPLARSRRTGATGISPSPPARSSPPSRRASRSARCCRASPSRDAPMAAAGGTG